MRRSRFSEEQIVSILKEHAAGERTGTLCRRHGISELTLYRWKQKYDGLERNEVKRLKTLEEANARLQRLVTEQALPHCPNEQWVLDFLQDALASGRTIRLLRVIDVFTREALALEVDTSLPASKVVRVLDRLRPSARRAATPCPAHAGQWSGTNQLSPRALGVPACDAVALHVIDPGKPDQNAPGESFHGRPRDECLNERWFLSLADARRIVAE